MHLLRRQMGAPAVRRDSHVLDIDGRCVPGAASPPTGRRVERPAVSILQAPADEKVRPWRVLVPIQPGSDSDMAGRVSEIAGALLARCTLLSVVDDSHDDQFRRSDWMPDVFLHGDPATRICHYARFMNADAILMCAQNSGRLTRFWQRSITGEVLRRTNHPVLVIPSTFAELGQYNCRKILCVLQLDGNDGPVLDFARNVARRTGGKVALLCVLPGVSEGLLASGIAGEDTPLSDRVALQKIAALNLPPDEFCSAHVVIGSANSSIPAFARKLDVDLVIFGRGEVRSSRPTVHPMIRRLTCPVLSVADAISV